MSKNVPNMLSAFRICLVPVFVAVYCIQPSGPKIYAAVIFAIASFTDFLDGFIARKYNLITNLGKVLDPLGDKLMTVAALTCIVIDRLIPVWVVIAVAWKECIMALGGIIIHRRGAVEIPASNIIGKTATVVFFIVCAALMIFSIPRRWALMMIMVALALMLMALGGYIITFMGVMRKIQNNGK